MADPKYQCLPYIALDQPDVYETGDLPESDQVLQENDQHDSIVEQLLVDPKDAFKRFNKATVDNTGSNISEDLVSGRKGYSVHYEIVAPTERSEETVLQKLQRLKSELKEIQDVVKVGFSDEVNPATILADVELLQRQVESFSSQPVASSEKNELQYGQLLTQLNTEIKSDKTRPVSQDNKLGRAVESDRILYELHSSANASSNAKEANLEARINQLEQLLGSTKDSLSVGNGAGPSSVMDSLTELSSKLYLLEEDNVDKLSARLQILLQTLTKVKDSSSTTEVQNSEKINELYELVKKWDTCADSLPLIVDRLYTLQDLHQQAMEFSASLKALESAQNELGHSVGTHQQLLADVQKTFTNNVQVIKSNLESVEKRIDALPK